MDTTKIIAVAVATVITVAVFAGASEMANHAYAAAKADASTVTQHVVANGNTTVVVIARTA